MDVEGCSVALEVFRAYCFYLVPLSLIGKISYGSGVRVPRFAWHLCAVGACATAHFSSKRCIYLQYTHPRFINISFVGAVMLIFVGKEEQTNAINRKLTDLFLEALMATKKIECSFLGGIGC